MFAAANNTAPGLVVSLLRAGARVNDTDDGGLTPLMYAAGYGPCAQTIAVLLRAGASARTRDYRGETALDLLRRNPLLKDSPAFDVLRKAAL
jgi:ankyrin repeat protein